MIPVNFMRNVCSILAAMAAARPAACSDISPKSTPELRTFTYVPTVAPAAVIPVHTPLQFNGSYPGQGDKPGQLGWWKTPPYEGNAPVDLVSFVQYNADAGVVFWAERTAFELYLQLVPGTTKTYAVKLGQPRIETPVGLAGNWTVSDIHDGPEAGKKGFGWKGDYESWFVCDDVEEGYYGLYFGDKLPSCGDHFVLEAGYNVYEK